MTSLERLDKIECMLKDLLAQCGRLRVELGGASKRSMPDAMQELREMVVPTEAATQSIN